MRTPPTLVSRRAAGGVATLAAALAATVVGASPAAASPLDPSPMAAAAPAATWGQDGYGAANTGFNPAETVITDETVGSLKSKWSIKARKIKHSCARQAPPIVVGNRMYLSGPEGVAAYNLKKHKRVWTYKWASPADEVTPGLALSDGKLFVARVGCQSVSDPGGSVTALDAATGKVAWEHGGIPSYEMVVDHGVVVVSGGTFSSLNEVRAYRAGDGTPLWDRVPALLASQVSANGQVLITTDDDDNDPVGSELVDITTGTPAWTSEKKYEVQAATVDGQSFYAVEGADLVRLDAATASETWRVAGGAGGVSADNDRLYVFNDTALTVRSAATGEVVWSKVFTKRLGKPVIAGGVLYVTITGEHVEMYAPATGASLGTFPSQSASWHPVVVNGWLYVTDGRVLTAFKA